MTTPPKPSQEAVEAAMKYTFAVMKLSEIRAVANEEQLILGTQFGTRCARILAAALHHERIELGHANDLLDQIAALCDGSGVGLREDVRGVLAGR